jgi:hypothetical protein
VRSTYARIALVSMMIVGTMGGVALASSLFGTSFDLGEEIRFEVQDTTTWWWGCCSCEDSLVLGWRIVNGYEQVVYSVIHDAPVSASIWQGSWTQLDMNGAAVPAGQYKLYVDTSVGTLSRCFTVTDPCACNWCAWSCNSCATCEDVSSVTNCSCRTTLAFVEDCNSGCFSLPWWGCCSSCP